MSLVTHFLFGWAVAQAVPGATRRERALVTLAGIVPDLDALGIVVEVATRNTAAPLLWYTDYHRVLGHNLWLGLAVAAIALRYARRSHRFTCAAAAASFHLHLLCDVVGSRGPDGTVWGVHYLAPISHLGTLHWSGQWPLNAWPNFLATGALLGFALAVALRAGRSPVEVFSPRLDDEIVLTLRRRFGVAKEAEPPRR